MLEWIRKQSVLAILVALLAASFAFSAAVMASGDPTWAYRLFGVGEKFRALEFTGFVMGGLLLAIGAVIPHRRARAMEEAAKAQAASAAQQAKANEGAEDGRRQERLKNAIEHLGHASDSVRLGGAYELFHLAEDTEDLRQTVLDILCAHIRWTTGEAEYREKYKEEPSAEIQSLLTLLFVQEGAVFGGCDVRLSGSWLNGAHLPQARLQKADFFGAYLQRAFLFKAQLQGANLDKARLQGAILIEAQLQEAYLHEARLQGAYLFNARLRGADLSNARLQRAYLHNAHLQGAYLREARLQGAELSGAHLHGAVFSDAWLQGANLYDARLQGANLSGVRLHGVTYKFPDQLPPFEKHIRAGIGRESDLSEAMFAGGLSRTMIDFLVEGLPDEQAEKLRRRLDPHIGKPASRGLPQDSGAIVGAYTEEEAERWIAEYEEAMRGVPKAGEG